VGDFRVDGLAPVPAGNELVLTLRLDLDGILAVTATEKSTGMSKTVRMETTPAEGRQRLVEGVLAGETAVGDEDRDGGVVDDQEGREKIARARDLRRRAAKVRTIADETDADEMKSLIAAAREAIAARQWERLEELNESLADLLFYLED